MPRLQLVGRSLVMAGALAAVGAMLWRFAGPPASVIASAAPGEAGLATSFDQLLVGVIAMASLGAYLALALSVALTMGGALAGDRLPQLSAASRRLLPGAARRLVLGLCGLGLAGASVTTAGAASVTDDRTATCPARCAEGVSGLRLPELPLGAGRRTDPTAEVTVVLGDSLWRLATDALPRGVSDARVYSAVQDWHRLNRHVIGADPDLIFPGTQLRIPGGHQP